MKIYLTNQVNYFSKLLKELCRVPVIEYDKSQLREKKTVIEINTTKKIEDIDLGFLFGYRIFPENIMSYLTQWEHEGRRMKVGDTIVQQVYIPPVKKYSQKILFGVRIKEVINEPIKKGFSYETLEGHVEKGISIFTIEKQHNDNIVFVIETFSEPATTLTKILGPIFSIPYQAYCTNLALKNVKKILKNNDHCFFNPRNKRYPPTPIHIRHAIFV